MFGFVIALALNINPIVIGPRLWGDKELRESVVAIAEQTVAQNKPGIVATPTAPAAPVPDAGVPLADLQHRLTEALNSKGISSTDATGLVTAADRFAPLRDAVAVWKKAATDDRAAAATHALAAADDLMRTVPAKLQALHDSHQRLRTALTPSPQPTPPQTTVPATAPAAASASVALLGKSVCEIAVKDAAIQNLCLQLHELSALQRAGLPIGWAPAARPTLWHEHCATPTGDKTGDTCPGNENATAAWWGNSLLMPAGWLIIALACTLGAPFWFDALGWLVKMRASGAKPEASTPAAAAPNAPPPSLLSRSPAGTPGADAAGTPITPMSDAINDDERKLTRADIERLQRQLAMPEPQVSGWFDGPTRRAIQAWQQANALTPDGGELSPQQITQLLSMA